MKIRSKLFSVIICAILSVNVAIAQTPKSPSSCNMYLDGKVVKDVTLEDALKWMELTPPTVQCDDGKVYTLEAFKVNFFTLKPLQNQEFGTGEGGFPIRARDAVSKGMPGDAIVLKEVQCQNEKGEKIDMPVISIKLK